MLLAAKSRGRAVVIGGGLLGLEAAVGLKEQGMEVSVVHLMPTLMERQLDQPAGFLLEGGDRSARSENLHEGEHQGDPRDRSGSRPRAGAGRTVGGWD